MSYGCGGRCAELGAVTRGPSSDVGMTAAYGVYAAGWGAWRGGRDMMASDFGDQNSKVYPGTLRGYRWWERKPSWPSLTLTGTGVGSSFEWKEESVADCSQFVNGSLGCWVERDGARDFIPKEYVSGFARLPFGWVIGKTFPHGSPPEPFCRCGFYAFYYPEEAEETGLPGGSFFGVIEASGMVIPGTKGFRAEKARIIAVVKDESCMEEYSLQERYPSVRIFSNVDNLIAAYPPQGPPA